METALRLSTHTPETADAPHGRNNAAKEYFGACKLANIFLIIFYRRMFRQSGNCPATQRPLLLANTNAGGSPQTDPAGARFLIVVNEATGYINLSVK